MRNLMGNTNKSTLEEARMRADQSWKGVFRVGGICLLSATWFPRSGCS